MSKFATVDQFYKNDASDSQIATMPAYFEKADPVEDRTFSFIFSTDDEDRVGDVIKQDGWMLGEFKKNPIALAQHRREMPIGNVVNIGVRDGKLRGGIKFAPKGASQIADSYHDLVAAGVLRATSVGFIPVEMKIRKGTDGSFRGYDILKAFLSEVSVVSVPCNSNCLLEARSKGLDISPFMNAFHSKEDLPTWADRGDLEKAMRGLETIRPNRIVKSDDGQTFAYDESGALIGEIVDGMLRITKRHQTAIAKKNTMKLVDGSRGRAADVIKRYRTA